MIDENYISKIVFRLLDSNKIEKISMLNLSKITVAKKDTLFHQKLGPSKGDECINCGLDYYNCLGHYGYLEKTFIYKTLYLPNIKTVLNSICPNCFSYIYKSKCDICKKPITITYKIEKITTYKENILEIVRYDKETKDTTIMSRGVIYNILDSITNDTAKLLGFKTSHPRDLMWNNFPIIPIPYRRNNYVSGRLMKSPITNLYYQIIKYLLIKNNTSNTLEKTQKAAKSLQLQEHILVNNEKYSTSNLPTISQILFKKTGLIRDSIITRMINPCIRAVITPADPSDIKINELGVPISYCKNVHIYDYINEFNYSLMDKMLRSKTYPRIHYRIDSIDNNKIKKTISFNIEKLEIGNLVARDLIDGDIVTLNRQPTLTKASILGMKVKVTSGKSLGLNTALCTGYGADFDGDEMNVIIPLFPEAREEIYYKMIASKHLISSATSTMLITPTQDIIVSMKIITADYFHVTEPYKNILLKNCNLYNKILPEHIHKKSGKKYYKGKDIFSMIIPNNFNFIYEIGDFHVKIKDGYLIEGIVDKRLIKAEEKGIILSIINQYNLYEGENLVNNLQIMGSNFLRIYSLTTSIRDFYYDEDNMKLLRIERNTNYQKIYDDLLTNYTKISPNLEDKISDSVEKFSTNSEILNNILSNGFYHFHDIVVSGGKGKMSDTMKCCSTIGQIYVDTTRFNGQLSFISTSDRISPYTFGLTKSCYLEGLNSSEIEMGNEKAIADLVKQQLITAKPGYLNKKINEISRDFIYYTDYTIRNQQGIILLPHYFNSFSSQKETFYIINFKLEDHLIDSSNKSYNNFIKYIYNYINSSEKQFNIYDTNSYQIYLPFDFDLIILNEFSNNISASKSTVESQTSLLADAHIYIMKKIEELLKKYKTSKFESIDNINKYQMLFALIYYTNPNRINLSKNDYDKLFDILYKKITIAQLDPGHCILLESGTSLNSNLIQTLLSAIHVSKTGGMNNIFNNFDTLKTVDNEKISSYIERNKINVKFERLLLKELISNIKCKIYNTNNKISKNSYIINYNKNIKIPNTGLNFTFEINIDKLIQNRLLLVYIQFKIIEYIEKNNNLLKFIQFIYIERSKIEDIPEINIFVDGDFDNIRIFINEFINIIENINIRKNNIKSIFISNKSKDDENYECVIEGPTFEEANNFNFINKRYLMTNALYNVFLKYGTLGYQFASYYNLRQQIEPNPKHGACVGSILSFKPKLVSINRQGLDRISTNRLTNIAFEAQSSHLVKASINENICDESTLSAQTFFGTTHKIGTNYSQILFDINIINKYNFVYKINNFSQLNSIDSNQSFNKLKRIIYGTKDLQDESI